MAFAARGLRSLHLARLPCSRLTSAYKTPVAYAAGDIGTRAYSISRDPMTGEFSTILPDIEPHRLEVEKKKTPSKLPLSSSLVFGHTFTDHMLTIPWDMARGWGTPKIEPHGPLSIAPSATVFHYAQGLFEGLKAYRDNDGRVTLFRPDMNMKRMNNSAERIALPTFNPKALTELIAELVRVDQNWIPQEPGHSLYIRPTMIGTQAALGVHPPTEALLYVICSPVGPYYPKGFKPVALYGTLSEEYIRAAPGGTGAFKIGANYAPGVLPQKTAAKHGYVQNLWLHGKEHWLTEVGTMNMFVVFKQADGTYELVTPPLDGMILPGITRDSVLSLARGHVAGTEKIANLADKLVVNERPVNMGEIKAAAANGTLVELFGCGTAAVISPVDRIGYLGEDVHIPTGEDGMGPVSRPLWKQLVGIQTGAIPHPWSVVVVDQPKK